MPLGGPTVLWHPSPNFTPRRNNATPSLVVLHHTAMCSFKAALDRLCDPSAEVSAHYLIKETGDVIQLVQETQRAWHAGAGQWGDITDVNSHSIGIELANTGAHPYPEPQMATLEGLLAQILTRHAIKPERVIAHSDMAPLRKSDPGKKFDWLRLARSGLSIWPQMADPQDAFDKLFTRFGFSPDLSTEACLTAFRLRFRPGVVGPKDATDHALIADLANRFPFDGTPRDT